MKAGSGELTKKGEMALGQPTLFLGTTTVYCVLGKLLPIFASGVVWLIVRENMCYCAMVRFKLRKHLSLANLTSLL